MSNLILMQPNSKSHNKFTQINIGNMTLQPKLIKSISNFYKDLKTRTAPCITRIPAQEIEKEYAFINGHNQFDTNK